MLRKLLRLLVSNSKYIFKTPKAPMKTTFFHFAFVISSLLGALPSHAHDTWLEAGAATVPVGEYTYVDLMLGNHGNDHRDFKPAHIGGGAPR